MTPELRNRARVGRIRDTDKRESFFSSQAAAAEEEEEEEGEYSFGLMGWLVGSLVGETNGDWQLCLENGNCQKIAKEGKMERSRNKMSFFLQKVDRKRVCVFVRARESVCVCVCVRERERERCCQSTNSHASKIKRGSFGWIKKGIKQKFFRCFCSSPFFFACNEIWSKTSKTEIKRNATIKKSYDPAFFEKVRLLWTMKNCCAGLMRVRMPREDDFANWMEPMRRPRCSDVMYWRRENWPEKS